MRNALRLTTGFLSLLALVAVSDRASQSHPAPLRPSPTGPSLSVVTLNLAMETDARRIVQELAEHPVLAQADVLLLQEVVRPATGPSVAEDLAQHLHQHVSVAALNPGPTPRALAVVSRYPLRNASQWRLPHCDLLFRSRDRLAQSVVVDSPLGAVRLFNAHLDTRINPDRRVGQLQPVLDAASREPGPVLIGGDFNTNPFTWVASTLPLPTPGRQGAAIKQLMTRRGFQTPLAHLGPTHDFPNMKLDWIYLRQLQAWDQGVIPLAFSDHHAVWTRVVGHQ